MFKRWRKKDNSADKSDEREASFQPSQSTEETSGFICPICMVTFDSPDSLQIHFVMAHAEGEATSSLDGDFVCPMCNRNFSAPEDLQAHFDKDHEPEELVAEPKLPLQAAADVEALMPESTTKIWNEREGSLLSFDDDIPLRKESEVSRLSNQLKELEDKAQEVLNLQQDFNDVSASLKEEKWYSTALKEEVEKITNDNKELQDRCKAYEKQKGETEKNFENKLMEAKEKNVKSMAEFAQLKVELAKSLQAHTGSQSEQMNLAQRASQLATENAGLKAKLEEEQSRRNSHEDEINRLKEQLEDRTKLNENLENQLSQRPSGGEVIALQGKLSSLQQQVSSLRLEKEDEQKEWQEKYNRSLQEVNNLQIKAKELEVEKTSKVEQMGSLQTALSVSSDNRKQAHENAQEKQQLIITLQHDLSQANVVLKEKETFVEYLQKQQEEMKNKLKTETMAKEDGSQQVRNLQNQIEETQRQLENKDTRVRELEASINQKKDDVSRLETERADLMAKIEAGEGADTAINQLKQEKDQLQSRLSEAELLNQTQIREHSSKIEEMYRQHNQVEEELAKSREQTSRLETIVEECKAQIEETKQKIELLKNDLREKNEVLVALEAAKVAEKAVLDNQVRTSQETLQEKLSELSALQQQHTRNKEDLSSTREVQAKLETKVQSTAVELDNRAKKCLQLENELQQKTSAIENLEQSKLEQRGLMAKQINEAKTSLDSKENQFSSLQAELQKYREESTLKVKSLEAEIEQLHSMLTSMKTQLEEKESKLSIVEKDLGSVREEKANLEGQLVMVNQTVQGKAQELTKVSEQIKDERQLFLLKIAGLESTYKQEKSELMNTLRNIKDKHEESKGMYTQKLQQERDLEEKIQLLNNEIVGLQEGMQELGQAHQAKITAMESDYSSKISESQQLMGEMQVCVEQKDDKLTELQRRIEILEAELKKECESCKNYESQLCRTQTQLTQEQEKVNIFETQLQTLLSDLKDLQTQISSGEEELARVRLNAEETEANLRQTVEQLNDVKNSLETHIMNLDNQLKSANGRLESLTVLKGSLEVDLQSQAHEYSEVRESLEVRIAELESTAEAERRKREKEREEAQQKQQMLIAQKLDLENRLASTAKELNKAHERHQETKEVSKRVQMLLKEETAAVQTKLANETREREEITEKMEQSEARLNIHIASLTENLTAARAAAEVSDKKASEQEKRYQDELKKSDVMKGDIAVLEATMQSNLDERRKLLERCVAGEELVEKFRKEVTQNKQQHEHSRTAMMELTQENQNLQIQNNQMSTRRWEEDTDVANCNSCNKPFSMTIRKHHCRNCGLIFCSECTVKTATLAASKKAARVCDTCYHVVTTGSIKVMK